MLRQRSLRSNGFICRLAALKRHTARQAQQTGQSIPTGSHVVSVSTFRRGEAMAMLWIRLCREFGAEERQLTEIDASLVQRLQTALARHVMPGASVAILKDGKISLAAAGVINVTTGVELTVDTVMHIGSIAKIFNATLLMQLVDEGLVDLDECILSYLPKLGWADLKAAEQMTVRMMLNHTSGINGSTLPDAGFDEETIEKGVQRLVRLGQLFPPGTEFSYCNPGTAIAGYIVQRVRQESWPTLVHKRIYEPLGMRHAIALPQEALLHRASVGHYLDPERPGQLVRTTRALLPLSGAPGGTTLMMSARDLVTFAAAHLNGGVGLNGTRILSQESTAAMQKSTVEVFGLGYARFNLGLGWMITREGLLNHNGGGPGIFSSLWAHPGKKFAVAVLTNGDHARGLIDEMVASALDGVCEAVVTSTFEEQDAVKPLERPIASYVGVYEDTAASFRVVEDGGRLLLSSRGQFAYYDNVSTEEGPQFPLEHIGDDKFLWRAPPEIAGKSNAWGRLFAFRAPQADGRMQNIGTKMHLYRRVPQQ
jgi:CubicO group peptidase (beta-lactamase class C family)